MDCVIKEFLPTKQCIQLSEEDVIQCLTSNHKTINPIPKLNRKYIDTPIPGQMFGLVSFIPAKGCVSNEKGFYGYVKLRGTFSSMEEVTNRENDIIRHMDSTNRIYVCRIGHPIPLVTDGYSDETRAVDLKEDVERDVSNNVRSRMMAQRKEIEEMEEREEELKRDVSESNPEEDYNARRTKLAVLRWTVEEKEKEINKMKVLRRDCMRQLVIESKDNPDWEQNHLNRYLDALKKANITKENELPAFMAKVRSDIYNPSEDFDD